MAWNRFWRVAAGLVSMDGATMLPIAPPMLIAPDCCRLMARCDAWPNIGGRRPINTVPPATPTRDGGAFFGQFPGRLHHLLRADLVWIARLQGQYGPGGGIAGSPHLTPTAAAPGAARLQTDDRITAWAVALRASELTAPLT